ncbi:MAG: undecaprenyldiphospho-muramoylpentapeptide beta-N-acetylglucosaminyltransferase [Bacteroidales bacterium]|nr:undecaprenyldiphospho-muramoylpentapeptide beta-N-acetylglucosaminyltransferase [Bacteroidales bacterium]
MSKRVIVSGGGTGGHIFPAIAIANAVKERWPDAEILFVGANGRMEMKRVPEAGYPIKGIDIYGLRRDLSFKSIVENLKLPFRLQQGMGVAKQIILEFQPDIVVGVGGYVSAPVLKKAAEMGIPTLIQEQNSYPGVTNRMLAKKARCICTAYDHLESYFPKEKTVKTGNPVRKDIINFPEDKTPAYAYFDLNPQKATVAILGGSLGARTINESVRGFIDDLRDLDIQFIWQTGEYYFNNYKEMVKNLPNMRMMPFVKRMDYLYQVADVIVSRAGALSISELCIVGKPCILIPSPNVAEDHQTKNARVLSDAGAAVLVPDAVAREKLKYEIWELVENRQKCESMSRNIRQFALPEATQSIVREIEKIIGA